MGFVSRKKLVFKAALFALIWAVLSYVFHFHVSRNVNFLQRSDQILKIADLAYYLEIVRAFWFRGLGQIYRLDVQQQILSAATGAPVAASMPLNVFPTALILWLPFAAALQHSMALAFSFWNGFSLTVMIAAFLRLFENLARNGRSKMLLLPVFFAFLSDAAAACLIIGQTSIFLGAVLMLLFMQCSEKRDRGKSTQSVMEVLLLLALSIKPQYFALGLAIALICRRFTVLIMALGGAGIITLLVSPPLGLDWPAHYLNTLQLYSSGNILPAYRDSFAPELMNIFRYSFETVVGAGLATLISLLFLVIGYPTIILASMTRSFQRRSAGVWCSMPKSVLMLLAIYLLFSPHSGYYEEVLIVSFFGIAAFSAGQPVGWAWILLWSVVSCVLVNRLLISPVVAPMWCYWLLKGFLLLSVVAVMKPAPELNSAAD